MSNNFITHYSDYASQPEIRIACTQKYHFPWTVRKDLPLDVYQVPIPPNSKNKHLLKEWFYTFDPKLVDCQECKKLDCWKASYASVRRYETKLVMWGISSEEYTNRILEEIQKGNFKEFMPKLDISDVDVIWVKEDNITWDSSKFIDP